MRIILNFFLKVSSNQRLFLIFIFFLSVAFSVSFLLFLGNIGPVQHAVPPSDYLIHYEPAAEGILQGQGIPIKWNFAPGYPILLSGIFGLAQLIGVDRLDLIVVFNIILTAISVCLLFLIVKELFSKRIASIAALIWMTYPFNLWFLKNPHTEVPFISLLYLGIFLLILTFKKRGFKYALGAGFFLAAASFIRLIGLFFPFPLFFLIFILLKDNLKRKFLIGIVFLLGAMTIIFPWAILSISKTGSFPPSSLEGKNALGHIGIVYGITVLIAPMEDETDRAALPKDVINLIERLKTENPENLSGLSQFIAKELINEPTALLKLIGLKLARSWYATSQQWWETRILLVQLFYLIPGFLGLIYIIRNYKDKTRDIIFLLSVIFYFWAMAFFNVSILRYMVPVMGLIFIFSAVFINSLINKLWRPSSQ